MKKQTQIPEQTAQPKSSYVKPRVVAQGSVVTLTLNSTEGAESEGYEDNIVWGN